MKYLYCILCLLLISCQSNNSKTDISIVRKEEHKEEFKDSLAVFLDYYDKFFTTNFNVSECPGAAVVIVKDSAVIYKKGFGVKQLHTEDSVDVNTVFRIASLSKGVTAVLAGNMVDKGELSWDIKVKDVVPGFALKDKAQSDRLEIHHLLSHTAGLYKYTFSRQISSGFSLDQLIRQFKYKGVVSKEGTDYEYQNAMFSVIEKAMEGQTQKTFQQLLEERVFKPAGMHSASVTFEEIKNSDNIALPHKYNHYSKKYYLADLHQSYYNVAAAGGVNASITDMGEYLKVLMGYKPEVISENSLEDIFNPRICTSNEETYVNLWEGVTDSYYAMGWRILDYHGRRIIYHGGNVNEYKTQLMIDPENNIGICVLFNAPNGFNGPVIPTFLNYYDFYKRVKAD